MEHILAGVEAVFFDVDGTLSDSDDQIIDEIVRRLHFLDFLWKEKLRRSFARNSVSMAMTFFNGTYHLIDRLGIDDFVAKLFHRKYEPADNESVDDFVLISGVEKAIEVLRPRFKLGIISTRGETGVRRFLQQFSLEQYFDVVVHAQTCTYTKPFPHPLLYAAEKIQVSPEKCLMVGDTIVDILAGKAAGMKTAGVLCGFGKLKDLRKASADLILSSPAELPELLSISSDK